MKIQFYKTPDGVKTWNQCYLGGTMTIASFQYEKKFTGYGRFTLVLPLSQRWLDVLKLNYLVEVCQNGKSGSSADWFIIQAIDFDTKEITLTGYDLSYLLTLRISVYINNDTQDYDPVSGTTAQCIKHYLDSNIISVSNTKRRMPMVFDGNGVSGTSNDVYLAKLKPINEIVDELCDDAGIGYVITADYSQPYAGLKFRLLSGIDRSIHQSERSPVILGASKRNVRSIKFCHDCSDELNCIWATGAGVTIDVYRDDNNIPAGIERRECAVDVDVQTVSDISQYALYAVKDNVQADSYTVEPDSGSFGVLYDIGDIISVKDDILGNFYDAAVTQAQISFTAGRTNVNISVGKTKMKLLDGIVNNMRNGTIKTNG